jgi:hypothetical protein
MRAHMVFAAPAMLARAKDVYYTRRVYIDSCANTCMCCFVSQGAGKGKALEFILQELKDVGAYPEAGVQVHIVHCLPWYSRLSHRLPYEDGSPVGLAGSVCDSSCQLVAHDTVAPGDCRSVAHK